MVNNWCKFHSRLSNLKIFSWTSPRTIRSSYTSEWFFKDKMLLSYRKIHSIIVLLTLYEYKVIFICQFSTHLTCWGIHNSALLIDQYTFYPSPPNKLIFRKKTQTRYHFYSWTVYSILFNLFFFVITISWVTMIHFIIYYYFNSILFNYILCLISAYYWNFIGIWKKNEKNGYQLTRNMSMNLEAKLMDVW